MRQPPRGRIARLFVSLTGSVVIFVVVPIFLGLQTCRYVYHALPLEDPLRLFKGIAGLLIVVVLSEVALSATLGSLFQRLLKTHRETAETTPVPGSIPATAGVQQSRPSRGYPGLDSDAEKARVLQELLAEEKDETIRATLEKSLEQHRSAVQEDEEE